MIVFLFFVFNLATAMLHYAKERLDLYLLNWRAVECEVVRDGEDEKKRKKKKKRGWEVRGWGVVQWITAECLNVVLRRWALILGIPRILLNSRTEQLNVRIPKLIGSLESTDSVTETTDLWDVTVFPFMQTVFTG